MLNTHDAYCAEVDIVIFTFLPGTMLPLSLGKSSSLWNQLQRLDTGNDEEIRRGVGGRCHKTVVSYPASIEVVRTDTGHQSNNF